VIRRDQAKESRWPSLLDVRYAQELLPEAMVVAVLGSLYILLLRTRWKE
jgi:hypothetical protein